MPAKTPARAVTDQQYKTIFRSGFKEVDQDVVLKAIYDDGQGNRLKVSIRANPYAFQSHATVAVWRDKWEDIVWLPMDEEPSPSLYRVRPTEFAQVMYAIERQLLEIAAAVLDA